MRAVLQRVSSASVVVRDGSPARIGVGLVVLLGIAATDTAADGEWLARKIAALRIFPDAQGLMNHSLVDIGGELLVVSQFTLIASTRKGTRPSFNDAAKPELAVPLYEEFVRQVAASTGRPVQTGRFGAHMDVSLVNDGPVTIILDSKLRE